MAFVLLKTSLTLFLICLCLPSIVSINSTKIQCNYEKFGPIGCPEESHMVCNNETKFCHCNQSSEFRINFGDIQCLSIRKIDEKCVTSDQCSKFGKNQLYCFARFGSDDTKLTKLETTHALEIRQQLNRTIEGFCRCDDQYYYDYSENECKYESIDTSIPLFDEFFCKRCKEYDSNSHCNSLTQTCDCNKGYLQSYDKCIPKRQLLEDCSYADQCVVPNSYCKPISGRCVCKPGYYVDPSKKNCISGNAMDKSCSSSDECSYAYGFCDPFTRKCGCDPIESIYFNLRCVRRTSYGQQCADKWADIVCELSLPHTKCSKYTNLCVCEEEHLFMSNKCQRIHINRFSLGDDYSDAPKNPMTYIIYIFSAIFGITIIASILIKIFRKPPRVPIYETNRSIVANNYLPTAPPVYSESGLRESSQTLRSNSSDNEEKPPSYEDAVSGHYSAFRQ